MAQEAVSSTADKIKGVFTIGGQTNSKREDKGSDAKEESSDDHQEGKKPH